MSKELNIELKEAVSNYQDKDLSLKVFMRGSIVLDIKIGADWVYPENYSVPYTGGECRVVVQKEGRNGRLESVLIQEATSFYRNSVWMNVTMVDSNEETDEDYEQSKTGSNFEDFEQISIPNVTPPLPSVDEADLTECCGEVDDCCGDVDDCSNETPNEE